jgi:hypothetical protein
MQFKRSQEAFGSEWYFNRALDHPGSNWPRTRLCGMRQAVECNRLAIAMSAMRKVKIIAVVCQQETRRETRKSSRISGSAKNDGRAAHSALGPFGSNEFVTALNAFYSKA